MVTKKKEAGMCCGNPMCFGMKFLVLGILIMLNAHFKFLEWWMFVGAIFALKGLLMMFHPK